MFCASHCHSLECAPRGLWAWPLAKPKDGVEHACIYVICDPCRVSGQRCVTRDRSDGRSSPHVQYRMFGLNTHDYNLFSTSRSTSSEARSQGQADARSRVRAARAPRHEHTKTISRSSDGLASGGTRGPSSSPLARRGVRVAPQLGRAAPDTARTARCDVTCKTASD